jgi:hypothetical protein
MNITFKEIWQVFSTGKGRICGLDAISLSAVFRIAEKELRGEISSAQSMRKGFLEHEPRVIGQPVTPEQLDELIQEIKKNTTFNGTVACNADGQPRYQNLPDVGCMITKRGFQIVILTKDGVERADA